MKDIFIALIEYIFDLNTKEEFNFRIIGVIILKIIILLLAFSILYWIIILLKK